MASVSAKNTFQQLCLSWRFQSQCLQSHSATVMTAVFISIIIIIRCHNNRFDCHHGNVFIISNSHSLSLAPLNAIKAFIHSTVTDSFSKMCTTLAFIVFLQMFDCLFADLFFVCCLKVSGSPVCAFTFFFLIGYHYTHHSLKKNLSAKLVQSPELCNLASPVAIDGTF